MLCRPAPAAALRGIIGGMKSYSGTLRYRQAAQPSAGQFQSIARLLTACVLLHVLPAAADPLDIVATQRRPDAASAIRLLERSPDPAFVLGHFRRNVPVGWFGVTRDVQVYTNKESETVVVWVCEFVRLDHLAEAGALFDQDVKPRLRGKLMKGQYFAVTLRLRSVTRETVEQFKSGSTPHVIALSATSSILETRDIKVIQLAGGFGFRATRFDLELHD